MNVNDLEELVITLRQCILKARTRNDAFEYCRLSDELRLAEAALASLSVDHNRRSSSLNSQAGLALA
ncbi:MAG TPA: hypothetical protein VH186_39105 [Chloroflexia bacterium]|nr:hypothetical protein [Chloroflexia bacterium]